ncbi:MAG: hypothetical protein ACLU99_00355 [Alphaproteobacteria bacterium]
MFRINQKGGTMVEAIAVISIMTVLGISAIKLIGGLFDGFKQNIVTSEIRELQKNVSARYSVDGHYGNLGTVATLVKEKSCLTKCWQTAKYIIVWAEKF